MDNNLDNLDNLDNLFLSIEDHLKSGHKFTELREILDSYNGLDWKNYVYFNTEKLFRKRIYLSFNIEVLILSWSSNYETLPHDHSINGCWLKVLSGSLVETIYNSNLQKLGENNVDEGQISFMCNDFGYHSIKNELDKPTFSIHIYSPPMHQTKYLQSELVFKE